MISHQSTIVLFIWYKRDSKLAISCVPEVVWKDINLERWGNLIAFWFFAPKIYGKYVPFQLSIMGFVEWKTLHHFFIFLTVDSLNITICQRKKSEQATSLFWCCKIIFFLWVLGHKNMHIFILRSTTAISSMYEWESGKLVK